jgi:transcriptional regulator with XRE-family HTH domain
VDYLTTFAARVRRLRESAGLTIQDACDRGGISANFWGKVERGEQEPCLLSIGGMAEGLGVSTQVLMTLEDRAPDNGAKSQINDLLDLCNPDERELSLRIVKAIYEQRRLQTTSGKQTTP